MGILRYMHHVALILPSVRWHKVPGGPVKDTGGSREYGTRRGGKKYRTRTASTPPTHCYTQHCHLCRQIFFSGGKKQVGKREMGGNMPSICIEWI